MASTEPSEEIPATEISFKIKTSGDRSHTITILDSASVLDLKNLLAGDDYEKIPANRQRLIYSGKVMKDEELLRTYKIKAGNTVHMVKNAQSNTAQASASSASPSSGTAPRAAAGVPTNMAAGTANNPLAGLTGARYAGHMGLPGMDMFGADGGMGAPPSEDAIAAMLDDPNMQQTLNEALNNDAMIDMMIQQTPALRDNPHAREMLRSPEFRRMMTDPEAMRQAARLRRMMGGMGGANAFPAPGVTDTTPAGSAGTNPQSPPVNPFAAFGGAPGAGNPFAALFGQGNTPAQTPPAAASTGQGTPSTDPAANVANPFASLFGAPPAGAGTGGVPDGSERFNPFGIPGMPPVTPEMLRQAMQMMGGGNGGNLNDMFGGLGAAGGQGATSPPPADTRPPEERYAEQLRQLNDMGFTEFDRNVEALRRSGGSVQGAIEQLLS